MMRKALAVTFLVLVLSIFALGGQGSAADSTNQNSGNQNSNTSKTADEMKIKCFTTDTYFTADFVSAGVLYKTGALFSVLLDGKKMGTARLTGLNSSIGTFLLIDGKMDTSKRSQYRLDFDRYNYASSATALPAATSGIPSYSPSASTCTGKSGIEIVRAEYAVSKSDHVKTSVTVINKSSKPMSNIAVSCRFYGMKGNMGISHKANISTLAPGASKTVHLSTMLPGNIVTVECTALNLVLESKGTRYTLRSEVNVTCGGKTISKLCNMVMKPVAAVPKEKTGSDLLNNRESKATVPTYDNKNTINEIPAGEL